MDVVTNPSLNSISGGSSKFDNNTIRDSQHVQFGNNIYYNNGATHGHSEQDAKRQLLEWISTDSASDRYQALLSQHQHGTGGWLISNDQFQRWINCIQTSSLLWLSGKMGSGKSVLASLVVLHLQKSGKLPIFFFCDKASRGHQIKNATGIYTCLLRQLVQELQTVPQELRKSFDLGERLSERSAREQILSLIQAKVEQDGSVVLVFDALDECDFEIRERIMYDLLEPLLMLPNKSLRVFLSTRQESDIEHFFSSLATGEIESFRLGVDSYEDINLYIQQQIRRLPMSSAGKAKAIQTLVTRCDGMFRWAEMCIASLKKPGSEISRLQRITLIPQGLMEIYDEIYSGTRFIDRGDQLIVRRALSYITSPNWHCADIIASELVGAVYGSDDDRSPKEQIVELLDLCCHMVELDEGGIPRFRLAHVSVRDYLEKIHEVIYLGSHLSLATLCIEEARNFFENPTRIWDLGQFVCYSLVFWPKHAFLAIAEANDRPRKNHARELENLVNLINGNSPNSKSPNPQSAWMRYLSKLQTNRNWLRDEFLLTTSDHSILSREMTEDQRFDAMPRRNLPNPLFIFARHDVEEVLLTQNPIPAVAWATGQHATGQQGRSVLEILCQRSGDNRLPRLMRVLPSHSKSVLIEALKYQGSVLVNAVKESNAELIEFLLQHSCSVLGSDSEGVTVLHYAAGFYDLKLTERLASLGANVNACTNRRESPVMSMFLAPSNQSWEWSQKDGQENVLNFIERIKLLTMSLYRYGANLFHKNVAGFAAVDFQQFIIGAYRPSPPDKVICLFRWIRDLMKKDMVLQVCQTGKIKTSGGWELGNPRSTKRWRNLVRRMDLPRQGRSRRSRLLQDDDFLVD